MANGCPSGPIRPIKAPADTAGNGAPFALRGLSAPATYARSFGSGLNRMTPVARICNVSPFLTVMPVGVQRWFAGTEKAPGSSAVVAVPEVPTATGATAGAGGSVKYT